MRLLIATSLLSFVLACEKSPEPTDNPDTTAGPTDAKPPVEPAPTKFTEMNTEQRLAHMQNVIDPQLAEVFKAFDGTKYATFGCATCHANNAHHPRDGLPKLVLSGDGYAKLAAEHPDDMKFMSEKVVPAMAKAMGEEPYDPATGKGYGCAGCHMVE
jgi:mono/diheme cytochrome c family protein